MNVAGFFIFFGGPKTHGHKHAYSHFVDNLANVTVTEGFGDYPIVYCLLQGADRSPVIGSVAQGIRVEIPFHSADCFSFLLSD